MTPAFVRAKVLSSTATAVTSLMDGQKILLDLSTQKPLDLHNTLASPGSYIVGVDAFH